MKATLDTQRLHLRRYSHDDAEAIFEAYANDPLVTRFLSWTPHESVEDTHAFIEFLAEAWESQHHMAWGVFDTHSQELLGSAKR